MFHLFLALVSFLMPTYDLDGPGYNAMITGVTDGDTLTVVFQPTEIRKSWIQETIRLYGVETEKGVNAPEIRGKEAVKGKISSFWVKEQLLASNHERLITTGERDSFRRLLADIVYQCHPIIQPKKQCRLSTEGVGHGFMEWKDY